MTARRVYLRGGPENGLTAVVDGPILEVAENPFAGRLPFFQPDALPEATAFRKGRYRWDGRDRPGYMDVFDWEGWE